MSEIVIGKRVQIGAAINGVATAVAAFLPEYSVPIMALAIPVTFAIQVIIANVWGVTVK